MLWWWLIWEILRTLVNKGFTLYIICSELGLKLMQWHENCICFLLLEGLVSTSSETYNDRLFTCYKSAKHITIVTQYIGNPEESKCHMPHNLSHRYSSGAHAHHLRFRASSWFQINKSNDHFRSNAQRDNQWLHCVFSRMENRVQRSSSKVHGVRPMPPSSDFGVQSCIVQLVESLPMVTQLLIPLENWVLSIATF